MRRYDYYLWSWAMVLGILACALCALLLLVNDHPEGVLGEVAIGIIFGWLFMYCSARA